MSSDMQDLIVKGVREHCEKRNLHKIYIRDV